MSLLVAGQRFYRVSEACDAAGISRPTFLRWVREGTFADVRRRDWRGWRLFSDEDVDRLKAKVNHIMEQGPPDTRKRTDQT